MQIEIKKCSDSLMWYAGHIGKRVTLVRNYQDGFLVVALDGYLNMVLHDDAEIVEESHE